MTAPTEEKLTRSTLQPSTLPTHVAGREREKEEGQLTTVCSFSSPMRNNPSFFLCSKNSAAPPQKPQQLGPSAQQSHCHQKQKQKKI